MPATAIMITVCTARKRRQTLSHQPFVVACQQRSMATPTNAATQGNSDKKYRGREWTGNQQLGSATRQAVNRKPAYGRALDSVARQRRLAKTTSNTDHGNMQASNSTG